MNLPFNPRVVYTLISAAIIITGAFFAIEYAKGNYRLTRRGFVQQAGLLSANSFPTGAQVFIDDKLVSATDDTIYLEPGTYEVKIVKDGFWPWTKTVTIQEQLVVQTNAQLFPIAPSLTPLTFTGVANPIPSPDGLKILYYTTDASSGTKNGLYVLELTNSLLSLQRGSRQLSDLPNTFDLADAHFIWSPDSTQIMILTPDKEMVIDTDTLVDLDTLPDTSFQRKQVLAEWEEEMYVRERQFLKEFPIEVISIATESAHNAYISPDKKRIMYTATQDVTLPSGLVPPVPAPNSQPEVRDLKATNVYVYDREEDRNFLVGDERDNFLFPKKLLATDLYQRTDLTLEASPSAFQVLQALPLNFGELSQSGAMSQAGQNQTPPRTAKPTSSPSPTPSAAPTLSIANLAEIIASSDPLALIALNFNRYHTALFLNTFQWFPDSKHIVYATPQAIQIKNYDGTNDTTVYSGPFVQNFVYPWPDGSKLVILTTFNPESPANLYAIDLK